MAEPDAVAFSVVIPTYRRNDLLAKCLDALSPGVQTLPAERYEVIVTDDGPEGDNAQAMIAERYPWARWTQGPRRGPASNRNHGARQVRSEWIVFTDDDCVPDPDWLQAFAEARAAYPEAEVLEGNTVCREGIPSPLYASPTNETGGYLWSCNMAIRKALFDELRGFDESFPYAAMEDVDFRERILAAERRFPFVAEAVVNHPPRPVPPPKRRAQMGESGFLFDCRRGQIPRRIELLKQIAYVRLREIYRQPKGLDSFRAIGHLLAELWELNRLFPTWKSKYRSA